MSSILARRVGLLLRVMRQRAGLGQEDLAARLEVSQATVSRWEQGRYLPGSAMAQRIIAACQAEALEGAALLRAIPAGAAAEAALPPASGLGLAQAARALDAALETSLRGPAGEFGAELPCFADIAAGLGEAQAMRSGPREYIPAPRRLLEADPGAYALRVSGESMLPLLWPGDVVVVSPAAALTPGCIVAAYVEPDGDVVKEYRPRADGGLELRSRNPAFPPLLVSAEGLRSARIWGRVVLCQREL